MAVVYSRENDEKEVHFGTSGYTMDRTFVLFDRESDSIWYPRKRDGALEAVSGPRKGDVLEPAAKSEVLALEEWLEKHPDSKVLLPAPLSKTVHQVNREKAEKEMKTEING